MKGTWFVVVYVLAATIRGFETPLTSFERVDDGVETRTFRSSLRLL